MHNILSALVSFLLGLLLNFIALPLLKRAKAGQEILQYVTEHKNKQGTPTMGGVAFICAIVISALLFCDFSNRSIVVTTFVFVAYGIVGLLDDYIKVHYKHNMGLKPYQKIIFQSLIAILVAVFVANEVAISDKLVLPISNKVVSIGWWIVPLVIVIYIACTNGVNLTDGIDGLATTTTIGYVFCLILLLGKHQDYALDVGDSYSYELTNQIVTFCYITLGALVSFLLFNCNNALVFMGDTGSLALGALVACVSIFTRFSLFIPILGLGYVFSCLSVIIQVAYFKLTKGKRVFLMAPYHHHLQKKGFSETRICVIYLVVTLFVGLLLVVVGG